MSTKQSKSVKKTTTTKAVKATATTTPKKAAATPKKTAATTSKKTTSKKTATSKKTVTPKTTSAAAPTPATTPATTAAPSTKKGGAKEPKPANPEPVTTTQGEEGDAGSKTRFFKVIIDNAEVPHGRFSGSKPKQAANKALTSIFKSKEQSGGSVTGKVKFSIVECTRGSKHKKYHYVGERVKLKEPMKVTIGKGDNAKVIEYKFNNKVMKDKSVTA
ncbi:hypothetical protein Indivirus_1_95 [Indivirus ILV1]|uniref:Chromosomal protein MC1 domain-containing protein n=1 Tax=Indivirus ILV1 TaxID=1977633 RepID=A0A1V0SCM9_9VIRU|nr:hypothetical protein Indivirus_1_95 [Indivirus ILV1]